MSAIKICTTGEEGLVPVPTPQDLKAEQSALSMLLNHPEDFAEMSKDLTPDAFFASPHRDLFNNLQNRHKAGQTFDITVVVAELEKEGKIESFGGQAGVAAIYTADSYRPNWPEHVGKLHEQETRRRMMAEAEANIETATSGQPEDIPGITQKGNTFPLVGVGDMAPSLETFDFVEDLLTEGGASIVYGPSNCGKTFWSMDLAAHVATGTLYRGDKEVEQGAVVYIALEGEGGARNRIAAMKQSGLILSTTPLYLCFSSVSLLDPGDPTTLCQTVQSVNEPVKMVVIDTLSRAMAGGDENGVADMTRAVAAIDLIRSETGAHVLTVHHCGKDEARGARGHSSLRAAVDTEIEVSRPTDSDVSNVRITKQRDLPAGEPMPFTLSPVGLGVNQRGAVVSSCTVHHEDVSMAPSKGRKPQFKAADLLPYLPQKSVQEWKEAVCDDIGLSRATFFALKKELLDGKRIAQTLGKIEVLVS